MSILVCVAHSEEPELGWAGPLHSGVASLEKIVLDILHFLATLVALHFTPVSK